ncbi:MAG: autoinducer binding domain-containing protein [Parvularculaceae bacterium]|nr:autoinducer binding domain-containing protein [Parvularculaceae bacterium]
MLTNAKAIGETLAAAATPHDVFRLVNAFLDDLGVRAIQIHNFRQSDEGPYAWRPLYTSFPAAMVESYAAHEGCRRDPIMRAALQSPLPVRVRDVLKTLGDCPTVRRMSTEAQSHGLLDGLAFVVVSRPGSFNYVSLAFERSLRDMPLAERCRIQREAEIAGRRLSALAPRPSTSSLTRKEVEVFGRMARGASNKEIARELGVAPTTVETLMSRGLHKLKAKSRIEGAVIAAREGLLVAA